MNLFWTRDEPLPKWDWNVDLSIPIILGCQHCYCLDAPPQTDRPLPHARCCKCGDVRVKSGVFIC
jgi:hypothetical protein